MKTKLALPPCDVTGCWCGTCGLSWWQRFTRWLYMGDPYARGLVAGEVRIHIPTAEQTSFEAVLDAELENMRESMLTVYWAHKRSHGAG